MIDEINIPYNADNKDTLRLQNRALDTKLDTTDYKITAITVADIDAAIIDYIREYIKPTILSNTTSIPVPILYGSTERWSMIRKYGAMREANTDKIQTPVIVIKRMELTRGIMSNPVNNYLYIGQDAGWNKRNVYDKFAALNKITPSKQLRVTMIPDYIDVTYNVMCWTEYEEQMSDLIGQFQVEFDDYWGKLNNYKFLVKTDAISTMTEIDVAVDRTVRSTFKLLVKAYLLPEKAVDAYKTVSTNKKLYTTKKSVILTEIDQSKI